MTHGPEFAIDYPALPDHLWIIWTGNDVGWPNAARRTAYLSAHDKHSRGFALFTLYAEDAMTFETEEEAQAQLARENALRPHHHEVQITTVADMKKARGYTV